jgi:hypothetical protein
VTFKYALFEVENRSKLGLHLNLQSQGRRGLRLVGECCDPNHRGIRHRHHFHRAAYNCWSEEDREVQQSLLFIFTATSNNDEGLDHRGRKDQVITVNFVNGESHIIETFINHWSGEDRGRSHPHHPRSRVSQVIKLTLTIQRYCAVITISIATGRHNKVSTIGE